MTTLSLIPTPELLQELQRRGSPARSTPAEKPLPPLVVATLQVVECVFLIPAHHVLGHCREEALVKARFAAWMLLADQGMTRRQMARSFDRNDLGTIRHGCLRGKALVRKDKSYARAMWDAYHLLQRHLDESQSTARANTSFIS
jgi:hypothetical protein